MQFLPAHHLQMALDDAELIARSDTIHYSYSGRAMYGSTCFGVVLHDMSELLRLFVALARVCDRAGQHDLPGELAQSLATDKLGLDMIFYFPGWRLSEKDDKR